MELQISHSSRSHNSGLSTSKVGLTKNEQQLLKSVYFEVAQREKQDYIIFLFDIVFILNYVTGP